MKTQANETTLQTSVHATTTIKSKQHTPHTDHVTIPICLLQAFDVLVACKSPFQRKSLLWQQNFDAMSVPSLLKMSTQIFELRLHFLPLLDLRLEQAPLPSFAIPLLFPPFLCPSYIPHLLPLPLGLVHLQSPLFLSNQQPFFVFAPSSASPEPERQGKAVALAFSFRFATKSEPTMVSRGCSSAYLFYLHDSTRAQTMVGFYFDGLLVLVVSWAADTTDAGLHTEKFGDNLVSWPAERWRDRSYSLLDGSASRGALSWA